MDAHITDSGESWARAQFVAADGVVIVGDLGGEQSAPSVVLMHGGGQTRHSWSGAMRALVQAGYRVINYDSRGHGDSGWSPDGVYSFPLRAADLRTVLGHIEGPFALIGASLGGITALQAIGDGLCPAAVVLVDIVLRPERSGVERVRAFMASRPDGFANLDEAVEAVAAYNPNRAKPTDARGLLRNLRIHADGRFHWHWDPRMVPADLDEELAAMERIIERLPPARQLPVLLIRGLHSDVLSDASVADFRRHLPSTEVINVAGAGHMVAGDSNEVFTRVVVDFLARHIEMKVNAGGSGSIQR